MASVDGFIGVFDSGVGGISVLRELVGLLPHEDFVFFGDSAHNPYGERGVDELRELSGGIVDSFLTEGAKAVVIACNTATSAAAAQLRLEHPSLPIVGVEPALKPATEHDPHDRILVMATPVTLRLDKFHRLAREFGSGSEVIAVPCVGLAHRIEQGDLDAPDLLELIEGLVGEYAGAVDSVVLGCTHYPFVARQIRQVLGDVPLFDGGAGTARRLRSLLSEASLLSPSKGKGRVELRSSLRGPSVLERYEEFFRMKA